MVSTTTASYRMSRASEALLAQIHGLVGQEIVSLLHSDDPRERIAGLDRAMRFLKDNNITSTIDASVPIQQIQSALPSHEELERLMTMTPD
jgi:hypothetical protein